MAGPPLNPAATRKCPSCGKDVSALARFCVHCRAPIQTRGPAPAPGCPSCGAPLPEGARFCPSCAAAVTVSAPDAAGTPTTRTANAAAAMPGPPPPPASRPAAPIESGGTGGKMALYLVGWLVLWLVVAAVVGIFLAPEEPASLLGVGLAALISLVLMLKSLGEQWEGEITEIRTERVKVEEDDEETWQDLTFAYLRLSNGKTRRMQALPNWRAGNRLVKRRGEANIRVL